MKKQAKEKPSKKEEAEKKVEKERKKTNAKKILNELVINRIYNLPLNIIQICSFKSYIWKRLLLIG